MPPVGGKGKGKASREHRRSRSRNTTPSSIAASIIHPTGDTETSYLEIPINVLRVASSSYDDILERHGNTASIPDARLLDSIEIELKKLGDLAELRGQACDRGMRELSKRRKERVEEERQRERELEERNEKLRREAAARIEEDDEERKKKSNKVKKRKHGEERPLAQGAHGVVRQDGDRGTVIHSLIFTRADIPIPPSSTSFMPYKLVGDDAAATLACGKKLL
jgi:transcriptional adapter 3